ncbi:uncharacterized GPI-anchored protein At5g19250-like [Gastrolobium bilobum]|uniref:uncharacterized GPI-anchored protein At5g19250-like n=1 Tax=Gastrolobium bilobum TaxID=150636 RepID=UPI002AB057EF|nr:uncharacterized GPI-anchored protein At5g19250-like [Gastrolobium bilobum]
MASFKLCLVLLAPVFAFLFLSSPAQCKDEEDSVFKGINSYRQTLNLPPLNRVAKASCLADEVADEIEDEHCENVNQFYPAPTGPAGANIKIPNLQKHIDKCDININTTTDGVILPVCVAKLEPTVLLSNYTHSDRYARYLNNSRYTGAGLGSEHDWMVLVLTTNTTTGTFSASISLHAKPSWMEFLLLPLLLVMMIN